jgi:subtilase family serine protease
VKHYVNEQWNDANIVGHYNLNVAVDPDNRTFEINESNNSMILPVYIEAPDLTVVNLTIDDLNLLEGNTVNITAKIPSMTLNEYQKSTTDTSV